MYRLTVSIPARGVNFIPMDVLDSGRSKSFNPRKGCEFHFITQYERNELFGVSIPARGVNFIVVALVESQSGVSFNPRKGCEFHLNFTIYTISMYQSFNPRKGCEFHFMASGIITNLSQVSIPARGVNFILKMVMRFHLS